MNYLCLRLEHAHKENTDSKSNVIFSHQSRRRTCRADRSIIDMKKILEDT